MVAHKHRIPALGRLKWEAHEFKAILIYTVNSRLA